MSFAYTPRTNGTQFSTMLPSLPGRNWENGQFVSGNEADSDELGHTLPYGSHLLDERKRFVAHHCDLIHFETSEEASERYYQDDELGSEHVWIGWDGYYPAELHLTSTKRKRDRYDVLAEHYEINVDDEYLSEKRQHFYEMAIEAGLDPLWDVDLWNEDDIQLIIAEWIWNRYMKREEDLMNYDYVADDFEDLPFIGKILKRACDRVGKDTARKYREQRADRGIGDQGKKCRKAYITRHINHGRTEFTDRGHFEFEDWDGRMTTESYLDAHTPIDSDDALDHHLEVNAAIKAIDLSELDAAYRRGEFPQIGWNKSLVNVYEEYTTDDVRTDKYLRERNMHDAFMRRYTSGILTDADLAYFDDPWSSQHYDDMWGAGYNANMGSYYDEPVDDDDDYPDDHISAEVWHAMEIEALEEERQQEVEDEELEARFEAIPTGNAHGKRAQIAQRVLINV